MDVGVFQWWETKNSNGKIYKPHWKKKMTIFPVLCRDSRRSLTTSYIDTSVPLFSWRSACFASSFHIKKKKDPFTTDLNEKDDFQGLPLPEQKRRKKEIFLLFASVFLFLVWKKTTQKKKSTIAVFWVVGDGASGLGSSLWVRLSGLGSTTQCTVCILWVRFHLEENAEGTERWRKPRWAHWRAYEFC